MRPERATRNYVEIVLTGGPGAGKSSSFAYLTEKLADRGIRALTVPEAATMVISGGVSDIARLLDEDPARYLEVQRAMVAIQRSLRLTYQRLAAAFSPDPVCVLYDRAEMDAHAYTTRDQFRVILEETGLSLAQARDSYDAVIHLTTAAKGAEQFYTTANNAARRESAEEARAADDRTLRAWTGHPHLYIVDNSTDFEHKLQRVFKVVAHAIGVPAPVEIERKFLLGIPDSVGDGLRP